MTHPATEDPMQGPLQELRRAVEALRPFLESPDQQAEFVVIEDALARLSAPRSATARLADFDPSRLSHLLDITGPDLAVELLARLTEDLTATQDLLETGVAQSDWKHLREGSHVLISLSGSVGALSLQAMSESLNAIAHRQDQGALDALMPPLSGELVALIQLIRATRPPYGTAR
jgi:HPt (histidine-containing phosphotransfer) domain-containing protein